MDSIPRRVSDRIGISTNLFLRDEDPIARVRALAEEFQYVEVEIEGTLRKLTEDLTNFKPAEALRAIAQETGATLNIHAPYLNVDYILGDNKDASKQLLMRCVEFASIVGSKYMTFHPGFRFPHVTDDTLRKQALETVAALSYDFFHEVKHLDSQLEFCLENTGNERPFFVATEEETIELFATAPLGLTLDITHAASFSKTQADARAYISRMAPYTRNVHLSDMKFPKHVHLPLGKGDFDIDGALQALEDGGYQGAYIVEEVGGGYRGDDYLQSAKEYREKLRMREDTRMDAVA